MAAARLRPPWRRWALRRSSGVAFDSMAGWLWVSWGHRTRVAEGLHPHTLRGLQESFRFQEATVVQSQACCRISMSGHGLTFIVSRCCPSCWRLMREAGRVPCEASLCQAATS